MDFDVLPKHISGRGVEIDIDAPILTDANALKEACRRALEATSEAIVASVVFFQRETFADSPGRNTVDEYGGLSAYYSSGMIPYWRGGLVGSFADVGGDSWNMRNLSFTAPYAETIENGGGMNPDVPEAWWNEKTDSFNGIVYSSRPHPFIEAVTGKIDENMENFGYLDVFAWSFRTSFQAW
jgi:hypothetical protein